jgi:hypothetical protein
MAPRRSAVHQRTVQRRGDCFCALPTPRCLAVGKSTAEAYELAVKALGSENFTRYKITEEIAKGRLKLMPEVLIGGGGQGNAMDGMLGLRLLELMDPESKPSKPAPKTKSRP